MSYRTILLGLAILFVGAASSCVSPCACSPPPSPVAPTPKVCTVLCQSCSGTNTWGALAFSPSTGRCGDSYNWGSEAAAENSALSFCGVSDCRIVGGQSGSQGYANQCGALAVQTPWVSNGAYATSGRQNATDAANAAIVNCQG
jgi:hypothetical protein